MYLEENYSDSPSNEYSRHYSAESESEYLRRQNMNSKLGEEQKKSHHVRRSPNFDQNSDKKQKKGQNYYGLILGRELIMPYYSAEYSDSTRHISSTQHQQNQHFYFLLLPRRTRLLKTCHKRSRDENRIQI